MPAETLAVTAREVFGDHRVTVEPRLADAIDQAAALAEAGEAVGESIGSGAVLVTGSVVTVGRGPHDAAAAILMSDAELPVIAGRAAAGPGALPRRGMCAAVLSLEAITLGLTTPVMITVSDVAVGTALAVGLGLAVACLARRRDAARASGPTRSAGLLQIGAIALGVVVPLMFFLGSLFALLWGTAYFLGRKIERERAAAYAAVSAGD